MAIIAKKSTPGKARIAPAKAQKKPPVTKATAKVDIDKILAELLKDESSVLVDIKKIVPNPKQPRKYFDQDRLNELAESIKAVGIIQPIVLRPIVETGQLEIIAGERRWRAAGIAKQQVVPAKIVSATAEKAFQLALIENLQREELSPIEEAQAYASLKEAGMTGEQIATQVRKSPSWVSQKLLFLEATPELKEAVDTRAVTHDEAVQVARQTKNKPEEQKAAVATVITRKAAKKAAPRTAPKKDPTPVSVDFQLSTEENLVLRAMKKLGVSGVLGVLQKLLAGDPANMAKLGILEKAEHAIFQLSDSKPKLRKKAA